MTEAVEPTILIVDDIPANIGFLAESLEARGYRVLVAQDGEEALQRAVLTQPDLILLDVMMPGLDGFEVCRRLKKGVATRDIPVIFMTARSDVADKVQGFKVGGVDYVTKPLQLEEVFARVRTQLELSGMHKRLERQNAQLQRLREGLEQRVLARTAELDESNRRLREEVAERKRAEEVLAERERNYRTLAENALDSIGRHDRLGRFTYLNPQLEESLGMSADEVIGKSPVELFPASADIARYFSCLMSVISTGIAQEYEANPPPLADGPRYHSILIVAERDEEGRIIGALTIGCDVTERKLAALRLAERERNFRTLAENLPDNVARYDRQERLIYLNPRLTAFLGVSAEERLGKTPREVSGDPVYIEYQNHLEAVIETGEASELELEFADQGGGKRYHQIRFVAERDGRGEIVGALAIGRDITGRKRAEDELRLLNQAIDNTFDATYLVDSELNLRYVNQAAVEELGYSREALLSMTLLDIDPSVTPEVMCGLMAQTQALGRFAGTVESTHRRRDGSQFPVEVGATTFTFEGEVLFLTTVRNITERKQAEQMLHERDQAIRAVVEHSPDAIIRYDAECRRIYLNPVMQRAFGLPVEQVLGTRPDERFPVPPAYMDALRAVLASGQGRSVEMEYRDAQGNPLWVDVRMSPEFDPAGKVASVLAVGRDISERKLVEQELLRYREHLKELVAERTAELQESRESLAEAQRIGHLGSWEMNLVDNVLTWSDEIYRIFEIDPQAFGASYEAFMDTVHPEDRERLDRLYKQTLEERTPFEIEHRLLLPDGRVKYVLERCETVFDEAGRALRSIGTVLDITERKLAEHQVRQMQEFTDRLLDALPDPVFVKDRQHRWMRLNRAFCEFIGHPLESLLGKSDYDFFPEDEADVFWAKDEVVFESGQENINEESFTDANGASHQIQTKKVRIVTGEGESILIGIIRDITERKQAEAQIRSLNAELEQRVVERTAQLEAVNRDLVESEQRYREIFDNAVEGMYLLEVTEDGRFRNIEINPALTRSTGIPRESMIGRYVDETVDETTGRAIVEKYRRCVAAGTSIEENIELNLPTGKRYYLSTITPIYYEGRVHRLIGVSRDITELKRYERELEGSRQQIRELAARRERAREDERKRIARELHDELGQMLTALRMDVMMLPTRFGTKLEAKSGQMAKQIDQTIQTVRDVVSMVRPSALDMGIGPALDWLGQEFSRFTGVECRIVAPEERIALSEEHSLALFRIVQESLTNVARHAQASRVDILLKINEESGVLEVRDNGVGFNHALVSDKKTYGLLGMRERVLVLGGKVNVTSIEGKGTTLRVEFPITQRGEK